MDMHIVMEFVMDMDMRFDMGMDMCIGITFEIGVGIQLCTYVSILMQASPFQHTSTCARKLKYS